MNLAGAVYSDSGAPENKMGTGSRLATPAALIGKQLGPYRITSVVGAGGMGEVYRAEDVRLGREVAVKILRPDQNPDPDRLRRFEQEARAAGMLNHPNILAIYDVGAHDGAPYVVSELLEGETLRELLNNASLAPRRALNYALQIASGLGAAHEKGVVHRDLKPENIFVTKDERIKILDFGLAKLIHRPGGRLEREGLSTVRADTEPGVIVGTIGYMSPEQVRGRPVDHRSDIFSFGSILYEMLSGRQPFRRGSVVETLNAILKEDPPKLSGTSPGVLPIFDRVVGHCLEKSPEERFQSARDLAFALRAVSELSRRRVTPFSLPTAVSGRRRTPALAAIALLLATAMVILSTWHSEGASPPSLRRLTFRRGTIFSARFSPDGQTIVYAAAWEGRPAEVFSTRPGSLESRSLDLRGTGLFAVSSAGELAVSLRRHFQHGYVSTGTLARAPLAGGAPREVLDEIQEADWSPDGASLAVAREVGGRGRVEFPVGKVLYETGGWVSDMRVSPKGDLVAFLDHPTPGDDGGSVMIVGLDGKRKVLSGGWASAQGLAWSAKGDEVWFTATKSGNNRALRAVTLSGGERLIEQTTGSLKIHDIARDGRVLLTRDDDRLSIIGLLAGGVGEQDLSWLDWSLARDLSADGQELLFTEAGEGGGKMYGVYLWKAGGPSPVRLGEGSAMGLSPDGKWALVVLPTARSQLILLPTGTGESKHLERDEINYQPWASWFPDGRRILFAGNEAERGTRLYVQDLSGGRPRPITPEGVELSSPESISPDGKFVAAVSRGRNISLYPVDGGEPRPAPGSAPGDEVIRWSADGRQLYVYQPAELPASIFRLDLSTGRRELRNELMPCDPAGVATILRILMTPDEKSYVYTYERTISDLYMIENLK